MAYVQGSLALISLEFLTLKRCFTNNGHVEFKTYQFVNQVRCIHMVVQHADYFFLREESVGKPWNYKNNDFARNSQTHRAKQMQT